MIKKEYKAVLEIVKFSNKNKDNLIAILEDHTLNWIEILGYLCYHRVAGIAYENINAIDVRKLDFPVFFTLYMIHQAQKIRAEIQKEYIKSISSALCKANIEHVFLKGAILSSIIYPSGCRAFNDIDILVPKKSIQKVKKILHRLGFLQGKYNFKKGIIEEFSQDKLIKSINTRGEMCPFVKIVDRDTTKTIDVDVNFSLDWKPNGSKEAVNHFLNEKILIRVDNDFSIYSLKEEHLFIQLCIHLYKDSTLIDLIKKRKVLDLYKFVDIYTFIQKYFEKINIKKIFDDSVKYGFDKYIFFALNCMIEIFPDVLEIKNVNLLYQRYNHINITKEIFDQYDPKIKMQSKNKLIERLFSYDIIKNYEKSKNKNNKNF